MTYVFELVDSEPVVSVTVEADDLDNALGILAEKLEAAESQLNISIPLSDLELKSQW